jgi:hypothetical protein
MRRFLRLLLKGLALAGLAGLLSACPDSRAPKLPPSTPQPKVAPSAAGDVQVALPRAWVVR